MIGIIGAMDEEVRLLCSWMKQVKSESIGTAAPSGSTASAAAFEFYSGTLEGRQAVVLRCGVGKVNAAVGCALLIHQYRPSCVINTGSSGGIDAALTFGDVVIAEGLIYHDVDVCAFGYAPGQIPGQPTIFPVSDNLGRQAERAIDQLKADGVLPVALNRRRGLIASGDVFMHEPERIAHVRATFPLVCAVEMEGAAIAHTCALFGVEALIIRALSDVAGVESPMTSVEYLPIAAKHSAEIARRIVKNV
jgi:adenosylhomocysteine nucleosidase